MFFNSESLFCSSKNDQGYYNRANIRRCDDSFVFDSRSTLEINTYEYISWLWKSNVFLSYKILRYSIRYDVVTLIFYVEVTYLRNLC